MSALALNTNTNPTVPRASNLLTAFFTAGVCMVFSLSGCGTCPVTPSKPATQTADTRVQTVIAKMTRTFEDKNAEALFDFFDRSIFPYFESTREQMRDFLLKNNQFVLDIIIDNTLEDQGDVSVQASWNRSWVDEAGNHQLKEGQAFFIFHPRPSGGYALKMLKGDSPFLP